MSEMAKKAREAMKSKARKLAGEATGKVDASSFTPSEPLNADVKTGMRPVSKRAYKKGGKVHGAAAKKRADRVQRKAGGKVESEAAEAKEYADAKTNRNLKDANAKREGKKHVGGLKTGGRAKKQNGGNAGQLNRMTDEDYRRRLEAAQNPPAATPAKPKAETSKPMDTSTMSAEEAAEFMRSRKSGGRAKKLGGGASLGMFGGLLPVLASQLDRDDEDDKKKPMGRKAGGRAKKMDGGSSELDAQQAADVAKVRRATDAAAASTMRKEDPAMRSMSPEARDAMTRPSEGANIMAGSRYDDGMKKGGRAKKQMGGQLQKIGAANAETAAPSSNLVPSSVLNFKPAGRGFMSMMKKGGRVAKEDWEHSKADLSQDRKLAKKHGMSMDKWEESKLDEKHDRQQSAKGLKSGGRRVAKKDGGCATGYAMGGYAEGGSPKKGKSKKDGKTHINIMIDAGGPKEAPAAAPMGGPPVMPPAMPPGLPPMPPAMPPGPPPMPPGGMPPAGFKDGGHVYPAMKYGAGSGEGRLEKMEKYGANARR